MRLSTVVRLLVPAFAAIALVACPPDDGGGPSNQNNQNNQNQNANQHDDGDCIDVVALSSTGAKPAGVSLHFEARDCESADPVDDWSLDDVDLFESGELIDDDADLHERSGVEIRPYIVLWLDMTGAPQQREGAIAAARSFVDTVFEDQPLIDVHVGFEVFGQNASTADAWQVPVDDPEVLHGRLDELADLDVETNETDGVVHSLETGLQTLSSHQHAVAERNHGGVVPAGNFIIVASPDTVSALADPSETTTQIIDEGRRLGADGLPAVQSWAVAFEDDEPLSPIFGGERWVRSTNPADADDALRNIADDMTRDLAASRLVGFCSSARQGSTTVEVRAGNEEGRTAHFELTADHFEDGCSEQALEAGCDQRECGGFLCGGCSDTDEICDAESGQCLHYCLAEVVCEDEDIVTDLGHDKNCYMGPTVTECADQCVDTSIDDDHCGGCDTQCTALGSECIEGFCLCPGGDRDCSGECVDTDTDGDHCGDCDHQCPDGIDCVDGVCECDDGQIACDGECIDTTSDDAHCGGCHNSCGDDESCDEGFCLCDDGLSLCGGACVDIFSDSQHCGGCDNVCDDDQSCENASCVCLDDDEKRCGDTCLNVTANDDHCGDCDHACSDDQSCEDGSCQCVDDGDTLCGSDCVDIDEDTNHCGGCGTVCPDGVDCVDGVCECDGDLTACDDSCVDTDSTPEHCGGCDSACDAGQLCDDGECKDAPLIDDKQLATGQDHTCLLATDGEITCWGRDDFDQSSPPPFSFLHLTVGARYTCGVRTGDFAQCWGRNLSGEAAPPLSEEFQQLAAGTNHTCGITTDDELDCWGSDSDAKASPPDGTFQNLSVNQDHSCAVSTGGDIECWGEDDDVAESKADPPSGDFVDVSTGMHHSCGLESDGTIQCWGSDSDGRSDPPSETFTTVSLGASHSCGVTTDETVECWGGNLSGQTDSPSGSFADVSAGFAYTCALTTDETVECWGDNDYGQSDPPSTWQ